MPDNAKKMRTLFLELVEASAGMEACSDHEFNAASDKEHASREAFKNFFEENNGFTINDIWKVI